MQAHILRIAKQTGSFNLDEAACYQDMKDECDELFQEEEKSSQPMFRCIDGKLQIFNGGYDSFHEWGDSVNLWGFGHEYFLNVLAKHLKGRGTLVLSMDNEGNAPEAYNVKENQVEKIF